MEIRQLCLPVSQSLPACYTSIPLNSVQCFSATCNANAQLVSRSGVTSCDRSSSAVPSASQLTALILLRFHYHCELAGFVPGISAVPLVEVCADA